MNDIVHQMYGYFGDTFFTQEASKSPQVVPAANLDLSEASVGTLIDTALSEARVTMFYPHSDLTATENHTRVANMKEFLIANKITKIDELNTDFSVGVGYELANKDGKVIKSGILRVKADYVTATIEDDVNEEDHLHYRKASILDGTLVIDVPNISNYGVKNCCYQYPYTLRLTKIIIQATVGLGDSIFECGCQMEGDTIGNGGSYACYAHHCECPNSNSDFSSHFVTNRIGTTIIDQLVVPAVLEVPSDYEVIDIVSEDLPANKYTFRFDCKLKKITINLEALLDNNMVVYDKSIIDQILEDNKQTPPNPDDTDEEEG